MSREQCDYSLAAAKQYRERISALEEKVHKKEDINNALEQRLVKIENVDWTS